MRCATERFQLNDTVASTPLLQKQQGNRSGRRTRTPMYSETSNKESQLYSGQATNASMALESLAFNIRIQMYNEKP